ncbi:hypothetical protein ACGK9R_03005 [Halomonas sp. HNIBRBA4712]|uniref:hypothetical protein n=1 Tax=Halomonas sp. HNIBRBA4712 TaxID=3373087 RepID=UPI0037455F0C
MNTLFMFTARSTSTGEATCCVITPVRPCGRRRFDPGFNETPHAKRLKRQAALKWALGLDLWIALTLWLAMQPFMVAFVAHGSNISFVLAVAGYLMVSGLTPLCGDQGLSQDSPVAKPVA